MTRLKNILPKAFLIGIMELVDLIGPEKTCKWVQAIGEKLGTDEGPGFEGARKGNINYLPLCPFAHDTIEFVEMYGERPSQFIDIIRHVQKKKQSSMFPHKFPIISNIFCVLHHSYRQKRANLAGFNSIHIGCHHTFKNGIMYNENAIKKVGMTKESVRKILGNSVCVFRIEPMEDESVKS